MAGRIRDEDVAAVRDRSPIADVIGEHVQLRNAGGGNLKGLCPFHEEKTPSLSVSPARGLFHCFGCGVGGDVIRFVQQIDHLSFGEAVEHLAAVAGVTLRYVDAGPTGTSGPRTSSLRGRLVEAHRAAAQFYAEQLASPEADVARSFLSVRGFADAAIATYGCGYAPSSWDALTRHLLGRGFSPDELTVGGLSRPSDRGGLIDRFHRRLLWPIRDISADVVGFGARRLYDDDRIDAKYLNTPETPIYKKSQLLYGLDLAKRDVARQHRAVIVEGYTDVMACHLAGVTTAVATCGTAFGGEHISLLRRLLMDSDAFRGEVIFMFDGDAAGMKAAERAFSDDQKFMSSTFVAVQRDGLDPCELRQKSGDIAVRDLVASRVPLVEFVLRSTLTKFDLETVEGRTGALDAAIPHVARIKNVDQREEYARRLAGRVGLLDDSRVLARVRAYARTGGRAEEPASRPVPAPVDATVSYVEREVLKVALQLPAIAGPEFDAISASDYLTPEYRRVRDAIGEAGGTTNAVTGPAWSEIVAAKLPDATDQQLVNALSVEALHIAPADQDRYARAMLARLQEIVVGREVRRVKSRMQRMNPIEAAEAHAKLFAEVIALEKHQIRLRERALGAS